MKKNKKKVYFLLDKKNLWIQKYLVNRSFKHFGNYEFKIVKNINQIKRGSIIFPLNYTKILSKKFIDNNLVLIVHTGKLPKDKGFAPMQKQILRGSNKIFISLIKASEKVDEGNIAFQKYFILKGNELYNELRAIQSERIFKIIEMFLNRYPKIKFKKQSNILKSSFNKKRNQNDSELNINRTIKQEFNKLRICDNEKFPAFFYYKNRKFFIKIYSKEK